MWTATASGIGRCPERIIRRRAYFARGSGHNDKAQYSEREGDYVENVNRL